MNEDILDKLIKQAVKEKMDSIEVPPMNDVFKNIMRTQKRRKREIFLKRMVLVVSSSFIVMLIVILGISDEGYTRFTRTLRTFFTAENGVLNLDNKVEEEFSRNESKKNLVTSNINELKKISTFPVKELNYLPTGYGLKEIEIKTTNEEVCKVEMIFADGTNFLFFTQMTITDQYTSAISIKEDNTRLSQEEIEGVTYNIIEYNNGEVKIIWDKNEVLYNLIGAFDRQEMMKIIENIK